jgi:hypothetical protein
MRVSVAVFIAGQPGSDEREVYATRASPDPKHSEVLIIRIFVAGSPRSPASRLLQWVLVQTTLLVAAANFVGAGLLAKAVCMRQGYRLTRCDRPESVAIFTAGPTHLSDSYQVARMSVCINSASVDRVFELA